MGINNRKELKTKAEKALERGKRADDFKFMEKHFLEERENEKIDAVVYDKACFIYKKADFISNPTLLTVYKFKRWSDKKVHFKGKEQIRDAKKYLKYDDYFDENSNFKHYKIS